MRKMLKKCISFFLAVSTAVMMISPMSVMAAGESETELFLPINDIEAPVITEMDQENEPVGLYTAEYAGEASDEEIQYWKQFSSKALYSQLSDEEKNWWDEMEESCIRIITGKEDVSYTVYAPLSNTSREEILKLLNMFRYSNPQYYFLEAASYYEGKSMALSLCQDCQDGAKRAEMTAELKAAIDSCLAQIDTDKKDEEIERAIYSLLAQDITYVLNSKFNQNVYSALVLHETVCAGYTMAMTLLLNGAGLEAAGVTGTAHSGSTWGNHAWNVVRIHGFWYLADATWGDQSSGVCYQWYNRSADTFRSDHDENDAYTAGMENAYYDGCISAWDEPVTYFKAGDYQYYIVNNNTARGQYKAKLVEMPDNADMSDVPPYVVYENRNYEVIDENSCRHAQTEIVNVRTATCGREGYTGDTYCTDCGKKLSDGSAVPKTSDHSWNDGVVTKEPTKTENGIRTYICTVCGAVKTESIDKLPDDSQSGTSQPDEALAADGWYEEEGLLYWYENGIRQGYNPDNPSYRGKEIYDPGTDAWYWLDNAQKGAVAKSKDVYQESDAGRYADREDGTGKWVRYDENGHMVKGWNEKGGNIYYFDLTYGTMAKGYATVGGVEYYFSATTGALEKTIGRAPEYGWKNIDGADYWYENYERQGCSPRSSYRGKELYDPGTDAWYWLDNVDGGKKATGKDVYQESDAGRWADREDGTGKWVRYDENGHMIKGWSTTSAGTYYFDPTYGTMAKGRAVIDGKDYYFDPVTGTLR